MVVATIKIVEARVEATVVPRTPHRGEDPHHILETQPPQTAPEEQLVDTGLLLTTHKAANTTEGAQIRWVATETSSMVGSNRRVTYEGEDPLPPFVSSGCSFANSY